VDQEHADYVDNDMPPAEQIVNGLLPIIVMVGPWVVVIGVLVGILIFADRMHL
jgi:hypothetical protein